MNILEIYSKDWKDEDYNTFFNKDIIKTCFFLSKKRDIEKKNLINELIF